MVGFTTGIRSVARKLLPRSETFLKTNGNESLKISTLANKVTFPVAEIRVTLLGGEQEEAASLDLGEVGDISIGRTRSNILMIKDPGIAKSHAKISHEITEGGVPQIAIENLVGSKHISYKLGAEKTFDKKIAPGKWEFFPTDEKFALLLQLSGKERDPNGKLVQRSVIIEVLPVTTAEEKAAQLAAPFQPQPPLFVDRGAFRTDAVLYEGQTTALTKIDTFQASLQETLFAQATTPVECAPILIHKNAAIRGWGLSVLARTLYTTSAVTGATVFLGSAAAQKYSWWQLSQYISDGIVGAGFALAIGSVIASLLHNESSKANKKIALSAELAEKLEPLEDAEITAVVKEVEEEGDQNRLLDAIGDINPVKSSAVRGLLAAPKKNEGEEE
ncbi:MAG: hypothetical protein HQ564_09980 [Candidatus Saganbacteria bacterium]|nr:hypothetical protein [Candidatus Saganbacteria bacterium]